MMKSEKDWTFEPNHDPAGILTRAEDELLAIAEDMSGEMSVMCNAYHRLMAAKELAADLRLRLSQKGEENG